MVITTWNKTGQVNPTVNELLDLFSLSLLCLRRDTPTVKTQTSNWKPKVLILEREGIYRIGESYLFFIAQVTYKRKGIK
ncbi:hypothetical protein V6Z11_A07G236200 [Gossypium hirsutum]